MRHLIIVIFGRQLYRGYQDSLVCLYHPLPGCLLALTLVLWSASWQTFFLIIFTDFGFDSCTADLSIGILIGVKVFPFFLNATTPLEHVAAKQMMTAMPLVGVTVPFSEGHYT